jgi:hypothetical protein
MNNSLQKIGGAKPISFQRAQIFKPFKSRHFEKGQTLDQSPTFLDSDRLDYRTTLTSRCLRYAWEVFFLNGKGSAMELVVELYVCTVGANFLKKVGKTFFCSLP